jgi:hypothetical protein
VGGDAVARSAASTWWNWEDGSRPIHLRWPVEYCVIIPDGLPVHFLDTMLPYRSYIAGGRVDSLTAFFAVKKGDDDVRPVYDGSISGLNDSIWMPRFVLPTIQTHLRQDGKTLPMDNCTGILNHTPPPKKTNRRTSPIQPPNSVAFASKETPFTAHITRTGPAPTKPSSQKIHAVALDFENVTNGQHKAKRNALLKAPNPDPASQGSQE